jgi:peptidoglycan/LPS O-acetylase OafA/YrhL
VLGALFRRGSRGGRLLACWLEGFQPGAVAMAGLCALGMWVLSQLSPFVPVIESDVLRDNLKPAWQVLHGEYAWRPFHFACYFFYLAGALLLVRRLRKHGRDRKTVTVGFFLIAAGVLLIKPFIYKHQLSLEAIAALVAFAVAVCLISIWFTRIRSAAEQSPVCILLLLQAGFIAYELEPAAGSYTPFNWVPFAMQNEVPLTSLNNILATTWPFMAAGSVVALAAFQSDDRDRRRQMALFGGIAVLLIVWVLEGTQCYIRGRYGDFTTVLLAVAAWSVPWLLVGESEPELQHELPILPGTLHR